MKITRAMKKIARLKGEVRALQQRIQSAMSCMDENEYPEDIRGIVPQLQAKLTELVTLKVRVMRTNVKHDRFKDVLILGEVKSYKAFIEGLEIEEGVQTRGFSTTEKLTFKSQISKKQKIALANACQERINEITDSLDEFNASTDVEESGVAVDQLLQGLSLLGFGLEE